jgi:hypothetical protein
MLGRSDALAGFDKADVYVVVVGCIWPDLRSCRRGVLQLGDRRQDLLNMCRDTATSAIWSAPSGQVGVRSSINCCGLVRVTGVSFDDMGTLSSNGQAAAGIGV